MLSSWFGSPVESPPAPPSSSQHIPMTDTTLPITTYDIPDMPETNQGGYAINIIRAVQDHAPGRIDSISREVEEMQNRIAELEYEKHILIKLIQVVNNE